MKIIVIGGGPAALESAIAARKNAPDAQIEIFSAENSLPYRRPALSGLLAAGKEIDGKTFFIKPAEFFNEQRIGFHPGCRAVKIEGSTLIFENGEKVGFDRLIIASGSNAVRLPIPGAEGENVFTLRSLEDVRRLTEKLDAGVKNAVIIGGGVLGLEIADSLLTRKIKTTVLEAAPGLFCNNLSKEDSAALLTRLNSVDLLDVRCGQQVNRISENGVELGTSESIPADLVVLAAGSRPDLTLPRSAGIACGRGIVVDGNMRSSRNDVFAAGDAAEFNGRCFNLYMDAVASGKIAGSNAAGAEAEFTAKPSPIRLFALGEKLVM